MQRNYRLAFLQSHPIQYFSPLMRRIAREPNIDLTVFYCSRQSLDEYVDPGFGEAIKWDTPLLEGYQSRFLPNLSRAERVGGFGTIVNPAIISELWRGRFDALFVHGHNLATYVMGILAAKALRIPVLMRGETHLLLAKSPKRRKLHRLVMTPVFRSLCAACLPIGTRNREYYLAHGVPEQRLFLVPYTVDNDFFMSMADRWRPKQADSRRELGIRVDAPVILYASKLMPRKRPLDLLDAYRRLRAEGCECSLVYVGSGEQESALRSYVGEHAVPDVHFFGFRNQTELPRFYSLSDIFVLPSQNEPWGLVINEVMCAGLPVVATEEIGAVADLVKPGVNGFRYAAGDVDALTRHLRELVTNPSMRADLGRASREMIERWSYEECVQGLQAALAALPRRA